MAATPQAAFARPYRDFLTPQLHRRFVHAAVVSLVSCYAVAVFQGFTFGGFFWSFFPLGGAGVRTALLFLAVFMTYILHIAQLHVGNKRSSSAFYEILLRACTLQAAATIFWYTLSGFLFCEAYMWSAPDSANLAVIDPGKPYERHKLNERPIFLRTVFMLAGVMQGLRHLVEDKTRITIPIRKTDSIDGRITTQSPIDLLRKHLHHVLISAGVCTAILLLVGYGLYGVFLRRIAWQLAHTIAKTFYNLPKSNKPPHAVVYILNLVPRIAAEGFLLFLLWDLGSAAFQANIAQPPLKNSLPLSTDAKDPNGTLLQGLLVKKEFTRTAAFWELALIAHAYPARRETIYKELDRAGGSTWSHIVTVCLGEVHAVSKRIQDFYTPPPSTQLTEPQLQQSQIDPLPRLAPPLKEGQVFTNPPPPTGNDYLTKYVAPSLSKAGALAKANGQSPHAQNPAAHVGKQVLEKGRTAVSSFEQQHQASRSGLVSAFWQYIHQFLVTWFGLPFRETFARRAAAVVIGDAENGGSNVSIIVDATDSLTRLAVCSLKEDRFGRVSRDVANIVRSYTTTITNIQNFIQNLNVRWTDVAFDRRPRSQVVDEEKTRTRWEEVAFQGDIETGRVVEEVGEVLLALREGLGDLLNEFGEFRGELGLSLAEMRVAKEAVGDAGRSTGKSDGGVR